MAKLMYETHTKEFDKAFTLHGRKRNYFSKNPNELVVPWNILGSEIYIECNLSANSIVSITHKLLALFNYKENDLKIQIRE